MRSPWHLVGLLSGTLLCLAAQAEGARVAGPTLEALKAAATQEFDAAAESLRESLARAEAHDTVGEAVAGRSLQEHRARYLGVRRAIARLAPAFASAADPRSPFVPDFQAPPVGPMPQAAAPSGDWDLFARKANRSDISTAGTAIAANLNPRWGMYGRPGPERTAPTTGAIPTTISSAAAPMLVYRAPLGSSSAQEDLAGFSSVGIHTTEKRQ